MRKVVLPVVALLLVLMAVPAGAVGTLYVDDTPGCGGNAPCYATIQAAVTAGLPGDTIQVLPGTYTAGANINKSLTLLGAQAGIDARDGRPGAPESIIAAGGAGSFSLNATNITFDGFKFTNMKGRTLDTYYNADNFTMRNCILQGNSGTYQGGSIQFGGGQNLHANGLMFEQNLVQVDNGYLLYMGHAMDGGTIRNNLMNGDSLAFGPFGARTGWLIEGNEFDGNVPGHGPGWGFGINANLGDVIVRDNYVHEMSVGLGQISVVGGSITGNTFDNNLYGAFQLWGGEWGSVVSSDVLIENNAFTYNGYSAPDDSHGFRLRPGAIDASTIHVHENSFIDLGMGTPGMVWAIRQQGVGAVDAEMNWWGTTDPAVIATMIGQGSADFDPWITCYVDDPAMAGENGFWPLPCGPQMLKANAVDDLTAMLATPGIASKDAKRIEKAIEEINKSLDPKYWDTAATLDPKEGDKVFDHEAKAVGELAKIVKDGSLLAGAVQAVIDSMVDIDRGLASEAIALAAGGDQHDLDKALKQLADGDAELLKGLGHEDNAIRMYREAWKHAQKALD